MNNLQLDLGIQEFQINDSGELLRFNPSDPNLFNRFLKLPEKISEIEQKIKEVVNENTSIEDGIDAIAKADNEGKLLLNEVFGNNNDFDKILHGINIMAVGSNGNRIIVNLFNALLPIFQSGAQKSANEKLSIAKTNRAQRRAAMKK